MREHWSCTSFADWIRGTKKPTSATGDEWKEWDIKVKSKHPIRYWIAEELLDSMQDTLYWIPDKLYNIKYYITNRWIDQSHALVAHKKHIKPGEYRDMDYRILHCLFDELVDFVEIEKAYCNYRWDADKQKGMKWWQVGRWRTRTWRSPEAGLEHLEWEASLTNEEWLDECDKHQAKPTLHAEAAREIITLYKWWTDTYVNRPDIYDVSGWSDYCEDKCLRGIGFMETDPLEDEEKTREMLNKNREIEQQYIEEETEMLIRLIKIRNHLWT